MAQTSFRNYVMAVDRVEQRLRKVTAALDEAGVKYAVIGGNAVAAWVGRIDITATRSTKDVDLLCDRRDAERFAQVLQRLGFQRRDVLGMTMFLDPEDMSARNAVHVIWANELVRPTYAEPAPDVAESVRDPQGFAVIDLRPLVRMKLTSNRDIDRVHIRDLLSLNMITEEIRRSLSPALRKTLSEIEENPQD